MAKKEKGFAFLAPLVIIIVLAVLGMGAFFVYQKSQEFSGQQNQNVPDQPANQNETNSQNQNQDTTQSTPITPDQACVNSGGKVSATTCYCAETADFYNNCAIGACTCTPDPSSARQIKTCDCGQGKCFNGSSCVEQID